MISFPGRPATAMGRHACTQRIHYPVAILPCKRVVYQVCASYRKSSSGGSASRKENAGPRRARRPLDSRMVQIKITEYAIPTIGLLAVATVIGPLVGAMVVSSIGFAVAIAAVAAAFSFSWLLVPMLVSFIGIPLIFGGGLASGFLAAGAASVFLFPLVMQLGLVAVALWVGTSFAKSLWFSEEDGDEPEIEAKNAVVDVEADTVEDEEDAWSREQELRDFDELLRKRERFRQGR